MKTTRQTASWFAAAVLSAMLSLNSQAAGDRIWHIKAVHPDGRLLGVKALVEGKKLPMKVLVSDDKYAPVKAIGPDGTTLDIKALPQVPEKTD